MKNGSSCTGGDMSPPYNSKSFAAANTTVIHS